MCSPRRRASFSRRRRRRLRVAGVVGSRSTAISRLLPVRAVQPREDPREALQRIRAQRHMRERLAARPREAQLSTHHLARDARSRRGLGSSSDLRLHPVEHAERRADRRQRPLGHAQRVAHPALLVGVQQHADRPRARVKPATDQPPHARELRGAAQHRIEARDQTSPGRARPAESATQASDDWQRHEPRSSPPPAAPPRSAAAGSPRAKPPAARSPKKTVPRRGLTRPRAQPRHQPAAERPERAGDSQDPTAPSAERHRASRCARPRNAWLPAPERPRSPPLSAEPTESSDRPSPPRGLGTVTGNAATGDRDCDDGGQLSERDGKARSPRAGEKQTTTGDDTMRHRHSHRQRHRDSHQPAHGPSTSATGSHQRERQCTRQRHHRQAARRGRRRRSVIRCPAGRISYNRA